MEVNPSSPMVGTDGSGDGRAARRQARRLLLRPCRGRAVPLEEGPPGGFAWNFQTNGPITATPIPTQFVVAFASNGGKLYVTLLDPPQILHRSQPIGSIVASMGTYGTGPESALLVPSTDGNLYRINLFTGEQRWVFPTGAPIAAEPLVGGGDVTIHPTASPDPDPDDHRAGPPARRRRST